MARACWDAVTETFSAPCDTEQSSMYLDWAAWKAVDTGGKDGDSLSNSCTHTDGAGGAGTTDPWWRVDLGTAMPVHRLLIWNRMDFNSDRLNNFEVWVTDSNSPFFTDTSLRCHVHGIDVLTSVADPLNITCGLVGQYVWIRLPGTGKMLTLCEVEVYEVAESEWQNTCVTEAACTDSEGSFACTCNTGYLGSGAGTNTQLFDVPYTGHAYSSTLDGNMVPGSSIRNRGRLDSPDTWVAASRNADSEWIQLDMEVSTAIAGVATKGRASLPRWVSSFKVSHSLDGITWMQVHEGAIFPGNTNQNTRLDTMFTAPVQARYIRIYPQIAAQGDFFQMRAGVLLQLGCVNEDECATQTHNCHTGASCSDEIGSFACACNSGWAGDGVTCTDVVNCCVDDNCDTALGVCADGAGSF
eukprot:552531-Rhodomonas_salina.1